MAATCRRYEHICDHCKVECLPIDISTLQDDVECICLPPDFEIPDDLYDLIEKVRKMNIKKGKECCKAPCMEYLAVCCRKTVIYNLDRIKKWQDDLAHKVAIRIGMYMSELERYLGLGSFEKGRITGIREKIVSLTDLMSWAYLKAHERYHCESPVEDHCDEEALATAYGLSIAARRADALEFYKIPYEPLKDPLEYLYLYLTVNFTLVELAIEHLLQPCYRDFVKYLEVDAAGARRPFSVTTLRPSSPEAGVPLRVEVRLPWRDGGGWREKTDRGIVQIDVVGIDLAFTGPRRDLSEFTEIWTCCEKSAKVGDEDNTCGL